MNDITIFVEMAHQKGFNQQVARTVFDTVNGDLRKWGHSGNTTFYVYRTGGSGDIGGGSPSERPRYLLAFPTADAALAFAQHSNLGSTPRLLRVSVAQLLAILVQRPAIIAVIFTDDSTDIPAQGCLPSGLRIDRTTLLQMLQGG